MLDSILGQETRLFQPPLTISKPKTPKEHTLPQKSHSVDTHDRKPIEGALVREGIHRPIDPDKIGLPLTQRDDTVATGRDIAKSRESPHPQIPHVSPPPTDGHSSPHPPPSPANKRPIYTSTLNEPKLYGKGQAHDPLSDFLWLSIGPSSHAQLGDPSASEEQRIVSESPPAAEGNIYETAYHEEVERIRHNSESVTLFLTRRVKNTEKYKHDGNMKRGVDERHAHGATGWGKMLEAAKEKVGKGSAHEDKDHEGGEEEVRKGGGLKGMVEKMKEGKVHEQKSHVAEGTSTVNDEKQ